MASSSQTVNVYQAGYFIYAEPIKARVNDTQLVCAGRNFNVMMVEKWEFNHLAYFMKYIYIYKL